MKDLKEEYRLNKAYLNWSNEVCVNVTPEEEVGR